MCSVGGGGGGHVSTVYLSIMARLVSFVTFAKSGKKKLSPAPTSSITVIRQRGGGEGARGKICYSPRRVWPLGGIAGFLRDSRSATF